jgi:hypothetical protein
LPIFDDRILNVLQSDKNTMVGISKLIVAEGEDDTVQKMTTYLMVAFFLMLSGMTAYTAKITPKVIPQTQSALQVETELDRIDKLM